MLTLILTVAHVILVTAGYVGLIATNAWLLVLSAAAEPATVRSAVQTWRGMARIFGPLVGSGILAGFALALRLGFPLTGLWLLVTYALVVAALGVQAAVMVPWQLRAESALATGRALPRGSVALVLSVLTIVYIAIAALMLLRPM